MCTKFIFIRKKFLLRLPLLAAAAALTVVILAGWGVEGDGVPAPEGKLCLETDGDGGLWLCMDPCLGEIGGGGAVALGVTLRLPVGWSWGEITPAEGASGMTLTVGDTVGDGRTVKILLDGYPTAHGEAGRRLLRMELASTSAAEPLWVEFDGIDGIFYVNPAGEIEKVPVLAEDFSTKIRDNITSAETIAETIAETAAETAAETVSETFAEAATEPTDKAGDGILPPEPPAPYPSVFVGCQESSITEGTYAIRFLFFGATPVICIGDSGFLQAETEKISMMEGTFSACTFRGLRAEGEYTFLVYTRNGIVKVRYVGGEFLGYFDTEPGSKAVGKLSRSPFPHTNGVGAPW